MTKILSEEGSKLNQRNVVLKILENKFSLTDVY